MKLAFSKPTGNEAETQLLFTRFRDIGYDGLQLKAGQYRPYLSTPEDFLLRWGRHPGASSALIVWGWEEDVRRVLPFVAKTGAELIVYCNRTSREKLGPDDIRSFAQSTSELGKEVLDHGSRLSLHNHYDQPVMYREDIARFFDSVTPGTVGLTLDTAHLVKSGVHDIAGVIREFKEVVDNFHLKDFADGDFKVLGAGSIDFAPVFGAIRDIAYDGWISVDEESGVEILGAMQNCHGFLVDGLGLR
jgi:sugar phosphate isomerase/epimerase